MTIGVNRSVVDMFRLSLPLFERSLVLGAVGCIVPVVELVVLNWIGADGVARVRRTGGCTLHMSFKFSRRERGCSSCVRVEEEWTQMITSWWWPAAGRRPGDGEL